MVSRHDRNENVSESLGRMSESDKTGEKTVSHMLYVALDEMSNSTHVNLKQSIIPGWLSLEESR